MKFIVVNQKYLEDNFHLNIIRIHYIVLQYYHIIYNYNYIFFIIKYQHPIISIIMEY